MPPCEEHTKICDVLHRLDASIPLIQKDLEYMRRDNETVIARLGKHVEDSERPGGRHERLNMVEASLHQLEERMEAEKEARNTERERIEIQRRNDLIMGRWFMLGAGAIGGGVVSGTIRVWGILSKIIGA